MAPPGPFYHLLPVYIPCTFQPTDCSTMPEYLPMSQSLLTTSALRGGRNNRIWERKTSAWKCPISFKILDSWALYQWNGRNSTNSHSWQTKEGAPHCLPLGGSTLALPTVPCLSLEGHCQLLLCLHKLSPHSPLLLVYSTAFHCSAISDLCECLFTWLDRSKSTLHSTPE